MRLFQKLVNVIGSLKSLRMLLILVFVVFLFWGPIVKNLPGSKKKQSKNVNKVEISGLKSSELEVGFGQICINMNFSGLPISIRNERFNKAILAHAPSSISFNTEKRFKYFKAKYGIDDTVGNKGAVRFLVYLDGKIAFASKLVCGGDPSSPVLMDISNCNKVALIVDDIGENYYDHSVWCDPEFLNHIPDGWSSTTAYVSPMENIENQLWDTGQRTFPNEKGLFLWKIIAGTVYIILMVIGFIKRDRIFQKILNLKTLLKRPETFILILTAVLMFWVFSPFWKQGLPASWDAGQHYFRCWLMKNLFLSNFKIDGWSPYWYLGVQQFLFYSPFLFFLVVLLHFFTFQIVPLLICFKLFFFGVYFCLPFACYWLMRQFKIDPLSSSIAALGVPSFSAIHGIGIESLFISGLFTQGFGLLLFCFILGFLRKITDSNPGTKETLSLGLLIGILFISHIISSIYFIFCMVVFALSNLFNRKLIFSVIVASIVGGVIAAFVIWPTYYFRNMTGPEVGWGKIYFIKSILHGQYFSSSIINIFAVFGFIIAFFLKRKDILIVALLAIITYFLASGKLPLNFGILSTISSQIFKSRTFPYLALFFIIFSGIFYQFLITFFSCFGSWIQKHIKIPIHKLLPLFIISLALIVAFSSVKKLIRLKPIVKLDSDFSNIKRKSFLDAFEWLRNNTPHNIIVGFDDRWKNVGNVGFNQFASQINIHGNRYTLQGNQMELTKAHNETVAEHLSDWPPERLLQYLKRYNVSYLYTWNDDTVTNLSLRPDLFRVAYFNGIVSVYQVKDHDFRYLANDNIEIKDFSFSPERICWKVINKEKYNRIVAAVAYHPNWKLYIDWTPVTIERTDDNLISFLLSRKDAVYNVDLKFQKSFWEYFYYVLSFFSIFVVIYLLAKPY